MKNLQGEIFGKLTVLQRNEERSKKEESNYWDCECICGNTITVRTNNLLSGHTTSCGCSRNSSCAKAKGSRNYLDLREMRFGKLIAKEPTEQRDKKSVVWKCICDCGNERFVSSRALTKAEITSCGQGDCSRILELAGKRFGYLTAISCTEKRGINGAIIWKCICDCGNEIEVSSLNLVQNKVKSCGCKTNEIASKMATLDNMTHGITKANTSGHVGVCWIEKRKQWKAQIGITVEGKKKTKHLG